MVFPWCGLCFFFALQSVVDALAGSRNRASYENIEQPAEYENWGMYVYLPTASSAILSFVCLFICLFGWLVEGVARCPPPKARH
jgi:hypothetical protein